MAPQTDEPLTAASSRNSLIVDYSNGGRWPRHNQRDKRSRRRACPVIALLGLLIHLIISGSGVAISVLIVRFNLQVVAAGTFDLVARILLFVASCMSIFYVFMHAFSARENYIRSHGSPQIFGYFTVALAVLIMRLGMPVWTGSLVLTALVAARKGFAVEEGFAGNLVWVQLGIASLGLTTLIVMVVITETTERPFATSFFSKESFIKAVNMSDGRVDTFDLSVSRAGHRPKDKGNGSTMKKASIDLATNQLGFDRSTINTPESPVFASADNLVLKSSTQVHNKSLVRVRSQPIPTPLEAVFTAEGVPLDAQDSPRKLAWRPPRESTYTPPRPQIAAVSVGPRLPSNSHQSGIAPQRASSSQHYSDRFSKPRLVDTQVASDPDTTMPPSPALGTPIETRVSEPLRIANPDQEPAQPQDEAPTLAKLLGQLSTRAAARRRNSLLVRQADLASRSAIDTTLAGSGTDMVPALFEKPADYVQTTRPNPAPRRSSLLVRQADLDVKRSVEITRDGEMSVFSLDPSTEFVEIPRPPEAAPHSTMAVEDEIYSQAPSLVRSNTEGPLLIRNFSRPGAPRPRTAGGEEDDGLVHEGGTEIRRGRSTIREEQDLVRRSRSLPPANQGRISIADSKSQIGRKSNASGSRKGSQSSVPPRFSAFPKAPVLVPTVGLAKVKGLGQGSSRRLDERIERWRVRVLVEDGLGNTGVR